MNDSQTNAGPMTAEGMARLEKLAPFARRAKCFDVGREKLILRQKRMAFVLLACDLADNSKRQMVRALSCPVYQALTTAEIQRLFGLANTKILGFRQGGMGAQLESCFAGCLVPPLAEDNQTETDPKD